MLHMHYTYRVIPSLSSRHGLAGLTPRGRRSQWEHSDLICDFADRFGRIRQGSTTLVALNGTTRCFLFLLETQQCTTRRTCLCIGCVANPHPGVSGRRGVALLGGGCSITFVINLTQCTKYWTRVLYEFLQLWSTSFSSSISSRQS